MSHLYILLVEDAPEYVELTKQYLAPYNRYVLDNISHLADFWDQIGRRDYDLILLDYKLPDGTGLELLQQMAARNMKTPVIIITGRGDELVAARTVKAGASEYIVKAGEYLDSLPGTIDRVIEQARLKRALEEAQMHYRDLFEQAVEGILICDAEGRIFDANPTLCQWLNNPTAQLRGQTIESIDGDDQPEALRTLLTDVVSDGSRTYEGSFRRKDGSTFPVEVSAHYVSSIDRMQSAVIHLFVRDITRRKVIETENARLIQHLQHSLAVQQSMQKQLVQAARLSAVGELAAGVAHQINNPLTTILADTQLLLASLAPEHPGRTSASAILEAGWRAQRVIQRLINFSSTDEQSFRPTDLNETIMNALDIVSGQIDRSRVDLQISLPANLPPVLANGQQLEEVWLNLLLNAREAAPVNRPGVIALRSRLVDAGEGVEVTVTDNGIGIRDADKGRIFTPFFTTKGEGRGSGLGLSVCQSIVRNHRGDIDFNTQEGHGTTFVVRLPVKRIQ